MTAQASLLLAAALTLLACSLGLVRRRMLSPRYGLGWVAVSTLGVLIAPALGLIAPAFERVGFTPTGFSLGVFVLFLIVVALQLSVSISSAHRTTQDLIETVALLEERLRVTESGGDEQHASVIGLSGPPR